MKWFTFSQNNSGGFFVEDENVCEIVCIEAQNADAAVAKAQWFMDNSGSCPCCGDRWSFWVDEDDGSDVPSLYGEPLSSTEAGIFREKARLHYADGRIETLHLRGAKESS